MNALRPRLLSWSAVLARLALAAVFLAAAAPKLADPQSFAAAVYRYQLLPDVLVNLFALAHAWLELVVAVALLLPRWRRAAAALIVLLLSAGALGLAVNLLRGVDVACGCFSLDPLAPPATWLTVARNLGLTVLAVWVFRADGMPPAGFSGPARPPRAAPPRVA